jgi:hypothetical protein
VFAQDSLSRHASDTILTMTATCQSIVITQRCVEAFRTYTCISNFPMCMAEAAIPIKPPCRDYCQNYCKLCSLSYCPCEPLSPKAENVPNKDARCVPLEDGHLCENNYVDPDVGSCDGVSPLRIDYLIYLMLLGIWLLG